jgi:hypothetical protein
MECTTSKSNNGEYLKQIAFERMDDNRTGNNIEILINFNSKPN